MKTPHKGVVMKKLLVALALMGVATIGAASEIVLPSSSVVNAVLVASKNTDIDLNAIHADNLSVQVIYSSGSTSAVTFGDGTPGHGTITVVSLTGLTTTYATNKITIASNTALSGANLYVNGQTLTEGVAWTKGTTSTATAISLCSRLNANFSDVFVSTVAGSVIFSTATTAGVAGNAYTFASSTVAALLCNSVHFTGGRDNAILTINNVPLQANRDWYAGANTTATALNIAAAINASSLLKNVAVSTNVATVVYATATIVGAISNFAMTSSTPAALSVSGFTGGTNPDLTYSVGPSLASAVFNYGVVFPGSGYSGTNTINETSTGLGTGSPLLLTKTAGTYPGPLVGNTTYYLSNKTATSFTLADTSTGAVAGVTLAITTATATGGGTFVLTPLALTGTPVFKLQQSNDGTNFQDVYVSTNALVAPFQASVSFASPYTSSNQLWNLGDVAYRWLRLVYTTATQGGVNLNYVVNAKRK